MFTKKLKTYLNKNIKREPFRSELFNIDQLGEYAKILAAEQKIGKGTKNNYLRERLDENEKKLQAYTNEVLSAKRIHYITPATEWLIDNFYLVEEHIQLARHHFPKSYSRELPAITEGVYEGFPRMYGIAVEYVSHVDAQIDEESLRAFFKAYQEVSVLKLGELWAIPIMLRLILIENLRRITTHLQEDQKDRDLANEWMDKVEQADTRKQAGVLGVVSDMAKTDIPLSSAFVSEFSKRLSSHNPSFSIVRNWLEEKLLDEGLSTEELIYKENQHQASDQVSVSNSIHGLRFLNSTDWRDFVEEISKVEQVLRTDPSGVYPLMDFASRDHYRHVVEMLAQQSSLAEEEVAAEAIGLTGTPGTGVEEERRKHVGYYLVDDGLDSLKEKVGFRSTVGSSLRAFMHRYPLSLYVGGILLVSLLLSGVFGVLMRSAGLPLDTVTGWVLWGCFFVFITQLALFLVNHIVTLVVKPDFLSRLDFSDGLPADYRSVVVIPTMISDKGGVDKLLSDLEIHYLANNDPNVRFALLTDFTDADEETLPADEWLTNYTRQGVRTLNEKYRPGMHTLFYLFHRPRQWNPEEKKWMGYERKRGKLMAFNNFLISGDVAPFRVTEGELAALQGTAYVVTLDADTQLPPCSIHKLVGSMAHVLNRPVVDPRRNVVVKGYGILQPRIAINLKSSVASRFARLFTDEVGVDPYTRSVSNVYQDIFHEGSFVGKGIYDVTVFEKVLAGRFPENRILSHDLLESTYVRSGVVGDVELYESYPAAYNVDTKRRHRWMRGDWQITQWVFSRVPLLSGSDSNPLSGVSKWKILDNLRRGLVSPLAVLFLLLFFFRYPQHAGLALLVLLGAFLLPLLITLPFILAHKPKEEPWGVHLKGMGGKLWHQLKQLLFTLAVFPHDAWLCTDAMCRSLWRQLVTHRHLLQWQTAEEAGRTTVNTLTGFYMQMWFSPLFALLCLFLVRHDPEALLCVLPFALLWMGAPAIAWYVSQPLHRKRVELTDKQTAFMRKIARKTWYFFETFVNEKENWLPPDNYQEIPEPVVAPRTSPTNIGLALLANLSAYDLGYLSMQGVIRRTQKTFLTLTGLKKFRGHFYNWYDTRTLEPLYPLYVSTVDSGNLAGHLLTLAQGLREMVKQPICSPEIFKGLQDTVRIMRELDPTNPQLQAFENYLRETPVMTGLDSLFFHLQRAMDNIGNISYSFSPVTDELVGWAGILQANCQEQLDNIRSLISWVGKDYTSFAKEQEKGVVHPLDFSMTIPSLEDLATRMDPFADRLMDHPEQAGRLQGLRETAARARERKQILLVLAAQAEQLAQMDFTFLYQPKKELFTIGYNVMEQRYDASSYDMLASEARLCSYLAIAQGQVPIDHWFSLGRLVVLLKGKPVLLSWSGSMFEYLMPLLVMPDFEETLLDLTYKGVVEEQIRYGEKYKVPWGVSESGYNRPDPQFNYQYQAFGIPSLGLKRGLSKDLVIAPYASMLAVMVDPEAACRNMQRLSAGGYEGAYGFYEAIDYTPTHQPINEKRVVIASFMAHHQGMGLVALVNAMKRNVMQRRFIACPQMKAFELLLQERVPHTITTNIITDQSKLEMESLHLFHSNNIQVERVYDAIPQTPEVNILSNGRYQVMLNTAGAGYSRWNHVAVTRWRQDPVSDTNGLFIYLREPANGKYWSVGYQPVLSPAKEYEVNFMQAYAEYKQRHSGLDIHTSICVSPEDDVELRCLHITNHTRKTRTIEITTYSEVVLTPQAAEESHPVFNNLFVQTAFDPDLPALFCTRRARSEEETPPYLFHLLVADHAEAGEVSFETDRRRFIGRGHTQADPLAMLQATPLSGTQGAVLDPAISLRRTVTVAPGKTVRVCVVLGMAPTQEEAFHLAEKYLNLRMTDRAFELAWTHSQVVLYNLNIREAEAQLFQRLAGALIYLNPALRAEEAVLKNNRKGQNGLWAYTISGDVPLVLVRISKQSGLELVRQLILAHAYWRMKGLVVELLILNEDASVYRQPLHDEIISLITNGIEASQLDKPGGIVVRPLDNIPGEDLVLLQSAARAIFSDKWGTLSEQLSRNKLPVSQVPLLRPEVEPRASREQDEPVARDLLFENGYGGFTRNGKEYVIVLPPDKNTPMPWSNVLANPWFGTVISESGGGYTWLENAHEFRLTPWNNDPVKDTSGEAIYIRDEETGQYWSPTPLPVRGKTSYTVRHGFGYSVFEHTENDIRSELWIFVAMDAPVKCSMLKLYNLSGRVRNLSVTGYCEWVLGDTRARHLMHIQTRKDVNSGVLVARNFYNMDFSGKVAFLDIGACCRVTGSRREFIGAEGSLACPQAMMQTRLSGRTGAGMDACGAVQRMLELRPGEETDVNLILGCAQSEEDMASLVARFRLTGAVKKSLQATQAYWNDMLSVVQLETPDPAVDVMANGWLLYQTLGCRIWARSGYYQSGGAYGFRDQLQDVMAMTHADPAVTRAQVLLAAHHQFSKGDVQHWWHPPFNRGVRTMFSDDYLWLPYVTHRYVVATGDRSVLDEVIPFLQGRELYPGEESYYDMPVVSDETATLYEHCVRSIRYGLKFGVHGLPLMGCGDWNDGMNLVGIEGKGESVWLAFFLYDVLLKFAGIAEERGDSAFAGECRQQAATLKENINREAWDGSWYRRAWFDDGTPLGSVQDSECRIDTLPQSWSVISGAGEPGRSQTGMEEVYRQLVDPELKIIRLFTPAFDTFLPSPGYIKGYVPGVRENGGQYTHGVIWTAIAFAMMEDHERAWELAALLNPVHHGDTEKAIGLYKTEPYVIAADVYSAAQHPGRGGWTWYTGSSAWYYRLLVETLAGVNRVGDQLQLTPRMHPEWNEYKVRYRYQETTYQITVRRAKETETARLVTDGEQKEPGSLIPLVNDRKVHRVEVVTPSAP